MIFKKGDKVYDAAYGWGEVEESNDFDIIVDFQGLEKHYTSDGKVAINANRSLSFTGYTLEGFSQERPLPFKVGDVVYLTNEMDRVWVVTTLMHIGDGVCPFQATTGATYSHLALENPLKNHDTNIYTKEDL